MHDDLELGLFPLDSQAQTYLIELRHAPAKRNAIVRVVGRDAVSFNLTRLRSLTNDPGAYGQELAAQLFTGQDLRDAFMQAVGAVYGRDDAALRLRLYIDARAYELHEVRWELLRSPDARDPFFLCSNQRWPFSRFLSSVDWWPMPGRPRAALRALIIIASPEDSEQFSLYPIDRSDEAQRARSYLATLAECVVVGIDQPTTVAHIAAHLRDADLQGQAFDLIYLVAHGQMRDDMPYLWLEQADRSGGWVEGSELAECVRSLRSRPRLAVLCSCQSAKDRSGAARTSLAPRLAGVGIPAIVAFQDNFSVESAQLLIPQFFQAFAQAQPVDVALAEGRSLLRRHQRSDWWMPLIYMRLQDGYVWPSAEAPPPLPIGELSSRLPALRSTILAHAPGLLAEFDAQAQQIYAHMHVEHALEHELVRQALAEIERICALIYDEQVDLATILLGKAPLPPAVETPFRGLFHFHAQHQRFFKGRGALVTRLVERLRHARMLAIVGASGSGKSSLAFAGIVPAFAVAGTYLIALRPSGRALAVEPGALDHAHQPALLIEPLGATPRERLSALEAAAPTDATWLVIVDQFEELFTLVAEPDRAPFVQRLLQLTAHHYVVLTMRADFWGDCALYDDLRTRMLRDQELIKPLMADELRAAVEEQAAVAHLRFEQGLAQLIFADVREEPGSMPLLQHALFELFERRYGRWLRLKPYMDMGRLHGSIAHTAEAVYSACSEAEQASLRRLFIALTRIDRLSLREGGAQDTRRRLELGDIVSSEPDRAGVERLIEMLASRRLLVKHEPRVRDERNTAPVELAHEAIIQHWGRMREWIEADRADLAFFQTVREAAVEWGRQDKRIEDVLHDGASARRAIAIAAELSMHLTPREQSYVRACFAAEAAQQLALLDQALVRRQQEYARHILAARGERQTLALFIRANPESGQEPYLLTARVPGEYLLADQPFASPFSRNKFPYGEQLHRALFEQGALGQVWGRLTLQVAQLGGHLRLELHLGPPELRRFRWEDLLLYWHTAGLPWAPFVTVVRYVEPAQSIQAQLGPKLPALGISVLALNGPLASWSEREYPGMRDMSDRIEQVLQTSAPDARILRGASLCPPTFGALLSALMEGVEVVILHLHTPKDRRGLWLEDGQGGQAFLSAEHLRDILRAVPVQPRFWLAMGAYATELLEYLIVEGVASLAVSVRGNVMAPTLQRFVTLFLPALLVYRDVELAFREAHMRLSGRTDMRTFQLLTSLAEATVSAQVASSPELSLNITRLDEATYDLELSRARRATFGVGVLQLDGCANDQERHEKATEALQELLATSRHLQQYLAHAPEGPPAGLGIYLPRELELLPWERMVAAAAVGAGIPEGMLPNLYRRISAQHIAGQAGPIARPPVRLILILSSPPQSIVEQFSLELLSNEQQLELKQWAHTLMPDLIEVTVLEHSEVWPVTMKELIETLRQGFDIVYWPVAVREKLDRSDSALFVDNDDGKNYLFAQEIVRELRTLAKAPRLWLLAADSTGQFARGLVEAGLGGAVVGVCGSAKPGQLQPLFRELTEALLRSGRADSALTAMRQAFPKLEWADQVVLWGTVEGLEVLDMVTMHQYRKLRSIVEHGTPAAEQVDGGPAHPRRR